MIFPFLKFEIIFLLSKNNFFLLFLLIVRNIFEFLYFYRFFNSASLVFEPGISNKIGISLDANLIFLIASVCQLRSACEPFNLKTDTPILLKISTI